VRGGGLRPKPYRRHPKNAEHLEIVRLLTVGFLAEDPHPPPRTPLAEIVHYDVYGNRWTGRCMMLERLRSGPLGIFLRRFPLPVRFHAIVQAGEDVTVTCLCMPMGHRDFATGGYT
jgi:hypothetical protein